MNSLANMFQGGMNNNYGSPTTPRKQFDVQPPVQNPPNGQFRPQLGLNQPQNGYQIPQNGGQPNSPFEPKPPMQNFQQQFPNFANNHPAMAGFMANNNFGQNFQGNQNFWQNHPRLDAWRQEHPNFGQLGNIGARRRDGWIDGDLGRPDNGWKPWGTW